ncbi:neurexin 1 isoform X2 [Planococcus citri]|uniref:neurexin 1 isoform X2 n=1 Tax=Planococcus citri TaxID=170843 RepID=UPI0031F8E0A6
MKIALFLLPSFLISQSVCFLLESTSSSYAQFRKWNVALNGSLEFEFKTDQPNGLLLYTDDGGTYDFFEIKLVEGALRLRYNLGGGAQIITVGRELNDGHWHKVSVKRNDNKTTLTLDDVSQSRTSKGKEFHFGNLATNSDVYIGGMPSWYNTKLTRLALPSVIFEPRFSGSIRNLVYTDAESNSPKRQRIKRSSRRRVVQGFDTKIPGSAEDICETEDPCKNGGICISTNNGPTCDCHNLEYEGLFCEKDKAPSEATFYGKEYVEYNLQGAENEATSTTQEVISFSFRTKYSNGFLFHSGNEEDYLNIAIKEGGISVLMKVTTGKLDMYIKPNKVRFDDYRWHKIILHRRIKEISAVTSFCRVSLTVDGIYTEHASTAGTFTMLSSSKLYIGGSEHTRTLPGSSTNQNFVGCLRRMMYEVDGKKIDIFDVAKAGSKLVTLGGQMAFACKTSDASDAISFTTPDSYLILPDWEAAQAGSFAIKFRTTESHGLLVFSKASGPSFTDIFAIELIEGQVYLIMDLGAGAVKEQVGIGKMNDGLWHSVLLHREGKNGRVAVDGFGIEFSLPGDSRQLDLGVGLFIGGIPWQKFQLDKFPVSIWSVVLRRGFVGCIRELILNEEPVDVVKYVEEQDFVSIEPVCHTNGESCTSSPCFNKGECINGWNRFICDCSKTEFTGPTCSKVSPIMYFNGSQNMLIKMPPNTKHQIEDILIRFKTVKPNGLLLATTHKDGDTLEIGIFGGKIRLMVKINNREKAIVNADQLNDNKWHAVRYLRYGAFILVQVDTRNSIKAENVFPEFDTMNVNHIHIGGYVEVADENLPLISARLTKFVGAMQQLTFNEVDYIEASRVSYLHEDDTTMPKIYSNAQYTKEENLQNLHRAFTILSKNTYVGLSPFKAFSSIHIYFQFKTKEPNGLIIFSGGKKSDYLAVELASGHIYVFFQMKSELIKIKDGAKSSFSDNRWHTVTIKQPTRKIYTLQVDDIIVAAMRRHDVDESLQLAGILYIGGIPSDVRSADSKPLRSKHGFQGCLANLHLNEDSPDLVQDALLPSTLIVSGCEGGSGKRCNHNTCDNRGICVQQWNNQICDCSMTSFAGKTCSQESISYEFGPGKGLITYTFPEDRRPEMKTDVLALGFITDKDDAVLFRVDSGTSQDYLELEIVEGNIFMVYNMGTQDQPIGEIGTKVNDNTYHIIRFTRNGANSTLQLDDFNTQTIYPGGHQLSVFNNQATIQLGGKWNRLKQRIERHFGGIISGLEFNGLRILDLASEKDRRTEIRGDVTRVSMIKNRVISEPPMQYQQMQPTPTSDSPQVTDELIFSGAGSGCNYDDEDHCKVAVQVDKDDLITPVYVAPSHHPFTPVKPIITQESNKPPCDDEDCVEGSGYEPEPPPEQPEISTEDEATKYSATQATELETDSNSSATISQFTPHSNITNVPVEHKLKKLENTTLTTVTEPYTTTSTVTTPATYPTTTLTSTTELNTTVSDLRTTIAFATTTTPKRRPTPVDPPVRGNKPHEANAAITIIIICAILIVIIVITILVLLFNRRTETNYKIESHKSFNNTQSQNERKPLSVLLPKESHSNMQSNLLTPPSSNYNNNLRMGAKVKKRQDVKEWYV